MNAFHISLGWWDTFLLGGLAQALIGTGQVMRRIERGRAVRATSFLPKSTLTADTGLAGGPFFLFSFFVLGLLCDAWGYLERGRYRTGLG
ncbi:hypothetical protein M406DRAFT_102081 [Cryphonectria parasitica EP155]|uniref:Uncharacterized protein n=1 Tax=Cryphonectria parasitica (strain ATCC 38755 / EP155) TaxID=660469 RepID=A0A9P4Y7W5_CRYP1|nr:uncharacterized protein M406DRAFT_102081 [Cryphonectria parasitica EP155]KAF3767715.1 hypothetical protein M406DRAFT_102081 [Cryphonectria parasitica EP155]